MGKELPLTEYIWLFRKEQQFLRSHAPDASNASWAMRFAASQPGVVRVLFGMNTMEQVLDNTAVFRDFQPLNGEEAALIQEVTKIIEANTAVAGCGYCTHGCPKNIAIPQYFALYNNITRTTGSFSSQAVYYTRRWPIWALAGCSPSSTRSTMC